MSPPTKAPAAASSSEVGLIAIRRDKASAVRARGAQPFANDVDASDRSLARELRQLCEPALLEPAHELRYDPAKVSELSGAREMHVFGRLLGRRGFGKAAFLKLRDGSGEIQLFARKDTLGEGFKALEEIDVADHIEARGPLMVTKTGELTVEVRSLRLLSKALRPLPDKWHGLTDIERRYRKRYVDLVANPDVGVTFRARSLIVQGLRGYLDQNGFLEVETPTLHRVVGGAAARPFQTHHNALDLSLFLRIAPELYLKRLLVGGFERVYEIGRCYRNEGISTRHNPEFTMLEFYQAYATYETLMPMTEALLRHTDAFLKRGLERLGLSRHYAAWVEARDFSLEEPFVRITMARALEQALRAAGLGSIGDGWRQIGTHAQSTPEDRERLAARIADWKKASERAAGIDWRNLQKALGACESDGERLFAAYEYVAEPFLTHDYRSQKSGKSLPVFIMDYPREVSPLARLKDQDSTLTDRFELFVDGRELCNAFSELNDPDDQAARFHDQVAKKSRGAEETMDYDEDYIEALECGMPPAAGFGLGVDRLVMTLAGQPSIRDVIAFPLLRPEEV